MKKLTQVKRVHTQEFSIWWCLETPKDEIVIQLKRMYKSLEKEKPLLLNFFSR